MRPGLLLLLMLAGLTARASAADAPAELDPEHAARMQRGLAVFEEHVRTILVNNCLRCHGGEETEAEFSLATRESLLKGGSSGPAVKPGDADASRLMSLIRHDEEPYMPMDASRLSEAEIQHIADWINNLAPYDQPLVGAEAGDDWTVREVAPEARNFWSFQPLADVDPPAVESGGWDETPIDRFIWSALAQHGLEPNPAADRRTLIRRAYLDLLGLPPTPAEVAAFVNDPAPDAWPRLIGEVLASPHYGERWGRHWLDLARFAESHGFEHDYDRPSAYHYRDFVIQALNAGMPYDRFVQWQLAGDELAPDERLALMATGFLAAGVHSTQITISEAERHRYDEMDDMLNTTSTAFLAMTVGCARCHDHKFDPIPAADYYRLLATFTTTIRSEVELNFDPEGYAAAKAAHEAALAPLVADQERYEQGDLKTRFDEWAASRPPMDEFPKWIIVDLTSTKSNGGATLEKQADGSVLAGGNNPLHESYVFTAVVDVPQITAIRLEALADPSLTKGGPGRAGNGNFALSDFKVTSRPAGTDHTATPVPLAEAVATFEQAPSLLVAAAIDADPLSAWAVDPEFGKDHAAAFSLAEPLQLSAPVELTFTLQFTNNVNHSIGRPRLSITTSTDPLALDGESVRQTVISALRAPADQRTPEQTSALFDWFRQRDPEWQRLSGLVREHQQAAPQPPLQKVLIASEGLPPLKLHTQSPREFFDETFFLKRGDVNQKVRPAEPGFLQAVSLEGPEVSGQRSEDGEHDNSVIGDAVEDTTGVLSSIHHRGSSAWTPPSEWSPSGRRTQLALWMTDVEHGAGRLLARVMVNRLWQHHFGRGIVATPSDFGRQGERPTHPELLDWLAGELIAHDWDLKYIHLLMMSSAAYQQSATIDPAKAAVDPDNAWVWRFARRRLEAEVIRDSLLAISGRLNDSLYGPGTLDRGMTRRSVYFTVKRSELIPAMLVFDAPDALGGLGDRPTTTVAPQALYLMNNDQVRQCAAALAGAIASETDPVSAAFRQTIGRDADDTERAAAEAFLIAQAELHGGAADSSSRQKALTDFCQVLLGLNELAYLE
jgi:cytochrome c553